MDSMMRIWSFCFVLLFVCGGVESLPHLQKAFKCAGDHGLICETGLCYDSLGFYENGQNVGCAPPEMCTQVGCFMYKNVFTCCCGNRFCNGKTDMLMKAKYEMFKQNHGAWPTNLPPRIFARNISVSSSPKETQHGGEQQSDVRLAPQRKATTLAPTTKPQQKTTIYEQAKSIEMPEKIVPKMEKEIGVNGKNDPHLQTSTHSSTTTKIATLPSSQQKQKTPKPLVVEKEVKLTSSSSSTHPNPIEETNNFDEEEEASLVKDNERTTRSSQDGKVQPTTNKPRKQKERKEKPKEAVKVESVKARKEEVHHPKSFPWYIVTIIGFVIASILGVFVYLFIKKYRQRRATQREDSLRNASSVDSSRISSNDYPNEHGRETRDPLLLSGNGQRR